MTLRIIDISSHQENINIANVDCDGVIIKVSGGTSYVNDRAHGAWKDWNEIADAALASGKLLAFYHYACEYDSEPGGRAEAEFFWNLVKKYKGKFIPILDWENHATSMPVSYAKAFLDRIAELSGATPFFYGYASNVNNTNYSSITKYPLWMASYLNKYNGAGWVMNPDNIWNTGNWTDMKMYQYTSTGYVAGFGNRLDLSVFYGTKADWERFCGQIAKQVPGKAKNDAGLKYHVHVQNLGDLATVRDGQTAGTTGAALRMEGIVFDAIPEGYKLRVKIHIQGAGWKVFDVKPGLLIGTRNMSLRTEALIIEVVERPENDRRKLHYQVHEQNFGWLRETVEGYATGCDGQSLRLEAVRIWLA